MTAKQLQRQLRVQQVRQEAEVPPMQMVPEEQLR
jgi:hypothetical protein